MKSPKLQLLINGGAKIWTQVSRTPERKHALPPAVTGRTHCPHTLPSALLFTHFPFFCCSNRCVITP